MNEFIHLYEEENGGIRIRISDISVFYYNEKSEKTMIYVHGVAPDGAFMLSGNRVQEICEAIRNAERGDQGE